MNDVISRDTAKPFKWVGTRPVRPDGVPKVTGTAQYGSDLAMPGMLVGRILRSPHAHARIRSIDISKAAALPGVKAVVTSADFPEQKFEYVGPERVAQNFWHMTRNIMAREKVLYEGHAVAAVAAASKAIADEALSLIAVDYEVLPHVIDVDEAMKPDAPLVVRRHDHPRGRAAAGAVQYREAERVQARRCGGRLRGGRRDRRDVVQDRAGASGLYRAARLRGPLRRRRPVRALELEPGAFRRARLHRAAARHEGRRPARLSGGDRRRVRRQDRGLRRAGRRHAGAQIRPSREGRDEPRGRVQGHRPDLGLVDDGEDRRQARRHDHRRRRAVQAAGRRISGLAVHEHVHVRVCALRHRERARGRLRRRVATARRLRPIARRARRSAPSRWRACSMSWRRRSAWTR